MATKPKESVRRKRKAPIEAAKKRHDAVPVTSIRVTLEIHFSGDRSQKFEFPHAIPFTLPRVRELVCDAVLSIPPYSEGGDETVRQINHVFEVEKGGMLHHSIEILTVEWLMETHGLTWEEVG